MLAITDKQDLATEMRFDIPFHDMVGQYHGRQTIHHMDIVDVCHDQVMSQRSPVAVTDLGSIAVNSVAAHQEMLHLPTTLTQYARQDHVPGHEILLFCNWPAGADEQAVGQTIDTIDKFKFDNPDVPLRYCTYEFPEEVLIGNVRKIGFDTATYIGAYTKQRDIMLSIHDGDITRMNAPHTKHMNQAFHNRTDCVTFVTPTHRHQRSAGLLPNMDSVIAWYDLSAQAGNSYYELGVGISGRAAMAVDTYDPTRTMAETHDMLGRIHDDDALNHSGRAIVRKAIITSSSRRPYEALSQGKSPDEFWVDNIQATESYRTQSLDSLTDIPDEVTADYIRDIAVANDGGNAANKLLHTYLNAGMDTVRAMDVATRHIEIGRLILGGPQNLTHRIKFRSLV